MSNFQVKPAKREQIKLRIALAGVSGSGKTEGALRLATGIGGKICVIDTEDRRSLYCADRFQFEHIEFGPPFTVESFIEAIEIAEDIADVVIIDSLSHEWEGEGGLLEDVSNTAGNAFTAWKTATPRHQRLIEKIKRCKSHIICTMRSKEAYEIVENDNKKKVPQKMGLKPIQREGMSYEFTVLLNIDISHKATGDNDHTGLFPYNVWKEITEDTGKRLREWAESGIVYTPPEQTTAPAKSAPAKAEPAPQGDDAKGKDPYYLLENFGKAKKAMGDDTYYKLLEKAFRETAVELMYNAVMKSIKEDGLLHANMIPVPVRKKVLVKMGELHKAQTPPPAPTEPAKPVDPMFAQNSSDPAVAFENKLKDAGLAEDFGWWMGESGIESIKDLFINKPGLVPIANEWYKEKMQKGTL